MNKRVSLDMKIQIQFFKDDLLEAIGAGIYEISINHNNKSKVIYIGESVFVLVRCASHLYELKKKPSYLGFTDDILNDSSVTLQFKLIESNSNNVLRKKREKELVRERVPLSQSGISDRQKNVEDKVAAIKQFLDDSTY